jgi:hypothetical protein
LYISKIRPYRFSAVVCQLARSYRCGGLFCDALLGVEAVLELLTVLVGRVVGKHLAARGALESLEAGLALDRLGGGVLVSH